MTELQASQPIHAPETPHIPRARQTRRGTVLVFGTGARVLNPLMARLAGRRHVRGFAVLQHRGRRSGRVYRTPVVARPTADGFIVPLPFGEQTDWFRNVQAAGEAIIRWNGADYHVVAPREIEWETARPAFHWLERVLVPLLGIWHYVQFQRIPVEEPRQV